MDPKDSSDKHKEKPNTTQLLSSAKVVAEAAKSTLRHDAEKVDKAKAAGAAADLIGAASHYAKLEGKGLGKYVEQAENYLHKYQASHAPPSHAAAAGEAPHSSSAHPSSQASSGSGGFGDYFKMAEGFLKKR